MSEIEQDTANLVAAQELESSIRADERAECEAEIAEWLRTQVASVGVTAGALEAIANAIMEGQYRSKA